MVQSESENRLMIIIIIRLVTCRFQTTIDSLTLRHGGQYGQNFKREDKQKYISYMYDVELGNAQ